MKKIICSVISVILLMTLCVGCSDKTGNNVETQVSRTQHKEVTPETSSVDTTKTDADNTDISKVAEDKTEENISESKPEKSQEIVFQDKIDWKTPYKDLLLAGKDKAQFYYVGLADLDFDEIPELIVSNNAASAACYVTVFKVIDGKAECVLGYNFLDDIEDEYHMTAIDVYSTFEDGWLTLRRNNLTGEYKYFMESGNGASNESFGSICSFSADSVRCDPYIEFEYSETWEDDDYYNKKGDYFVAGKTASKEEYESELKKCYETWHDVGLHGCDITEDFEICKNMTDGSEREEFMMKIFMSYLPEKQFIS